MRLRILILLALALSLVLPSVAQAQFGSLSVSPTQGPPGTRVTITGTGWDSTIIDHLPIDMLAPVNGPYTYNKEVALIEKVCTDTCGFSTVVTVPSDAAPGSYIFGAQVGHNSVTGAPRIVASATFAVTKATSLGPRCKWRTGVACRAV